MEIFAPPLNLGRNLIINGNFAVNQRGYVSGGALASGSGYAHDRWRDYYNGGGTYTFTQTVPDTTITVNGTGPCQIVEPQNVAGGVYVLSWQGTSQAYFRYTPPGSGQSEQQVGPVSAPFVTPACAAGARLVVIFTPGTVGLVQLEAGTTPTPFERRPIAVELMLCYRYFYSTYPTGFAPGSNAPGNCPSIFLDTASSYALLCRVTLPVEMRASPTVTTYSGDGAKTGQASGNNGSYYPIHLPCSSPKVIEVAFNAASAPSGVTYAVALTASAEL